MTLALGFARPRTDVRGAEKQSGATDIYRVGPRWFAVVGIVVSGCGPSATKMGLSCHLVAQGTQAVFANLYPWGYS